MHTISEISHDTVTKTYICLNSKQYIGCLMLLLFIWNTLTVSMTVSTTIPLHQDPLGVDVAGLQGMQ